MKASTRLSWLAVVENCEISRGWDNQWTGQRDSKKKENENVVQMYLQTEVSQVFMCWLVLTLAQFHIFFIALIEPDQFTQPRRQQAKPKEANPDVTICGWSVPVRLEYQWSEAIWISND